MLKGPSRFVREFAMLAQTKKEDKAFTAAPGW
jgi:hypothetical protein